MSTLNQNKNTPPKSNPKHLHPRNLHKHGYDFSALVKSYPSLAPFVKPNAHGNTSIDFANPKAVKSLNAALLKHHYNINNWDIPQGALCPPIPGRVDYIHYIAELLGIGEPITNKISNRTTGKRNVRMLDIGTGANGIYPLLACQIYNWHCVGSDINTESINNVSTIIAKNPKLKNCFELRTQSDKSHIFEGIIRASEHFDVTVCNPPFHASQEEALKGSKRKLDNLARNRGEQKVASPSKNNATLNFGGLDAELWCKGGERMFLKKLIKESQTFSAQCRWFTSLVSKIDNVKPAKKLIQKLGATDVREIEMKQGNKITRVLAWTFV
ncbi:23S rRNA (adenine(1618)-N(6))-methyltransferase RlmF [Cognaticolwellia mytili]|uniref:23S rRNA (adenine(1618)-N(6))-methyltransferase RlmF n=1 Tax=Cognaticolwellia mytili TaxID=1888913 RepID=UPI000A1784B2|nr:23S rRNA (adenine(1618)-N(6))-methyltransferase RlmF [Cognaticolwellia mytili]